MGGAGSGPAKKSREHHEFNGTYRADRMGGRLETAMGKPIKPKGMTDEANLHWDNVVPVLVEMKVAKEIDTDALETLCDWWSDYKKYSDVDSELPEKIRIGLKNLSFNNWKGMMVKFGMSPADRANLVQPGAEKETLEDWLK